MAGFSGIIKAQDRPIADGPLFDKEYKACYNENQIRQQSHLPVRKGAIMKKSDPFAYGFRLTSVIILTVLFLFTGCSPMAASTSSSGTLIPDVTAGDAETNSPKTTPETTPEPDPVLTFIPDPDHPLPEEDCILPLGEAFRVGGTIKANLPLDSISVQVICARNSQDLYPYRKSVRIGTNQSEYSLTDTPGSGESLSQLLDFSEFTVGAHTLTLSASCRGHSPETLLTCHFYIAGPDWEMISEDDFPDSYPEALAFFGSEERFLYHYQWVDDRYILADPEWEKAYITTMPGLPEGEEWLVHTDAVPYYEKVLDYLDTTFFRVSGTNGDTGILRASRLVSTYNGCYVSRFTSSRKWISHHAFGTALDLNARMQPNKNEPENKELIQTEVQDLLTYNGIVEEDGILYYDFTYSGEYENDRNGVPQTCVNYLLYELAFYRAGFGWAHYYKSSSDGMHFCLSEFITYSHEDPEMGLRKVFEYADPQMAEEPEGSQGESKKAIHAKHP